MPVGWKGKSYGGKGIIKKKSGKHLSNQEMVRNKEGLMHWRHNGGNPEKVNWGQAIYTVKPLFSTQIQPDEILLRKGQATSSSSVTAYVTGGKSIYYHLSGPSSYQNILIFSYGSLHTLFSVPRYNFYMFSEGLRLYIFSKAQPSDWK